MRLRFALLPPVLAMTLGCIIQAPSTPRPAPSGMVPAPPMASASPSPSPSPTVRPSTSWDPNRQRPIRVGGRSDLALEGPYTLVAGERTFRCFYEGRAPLTVWLIRQDGQTDAELFDREGPFSDTTRHTVTVTQGYHVQVTGANGPWRIEID
ncbi:MAG: hypothetical protein ACK46X_13375 [Candidatus Sericytochromatia bacterium]